ncbi:tryptophan synthase beta subunit-like PLP-dependent enzyme, partial [Rozella allomycis CSF55]
MSPSRVIDLIPNQNAKINASVDLECTTALPTTIKSHIGPETADGIFDDIEYLRMILTARVYDVCEETPLVTARNLSHRLANTIYLKREDLQPVFSFKCRGAYNRMSKLTEEEKQRGVIAVSAGNHAQGVALAAKKMNIRAVIVMPKGSPEIKWANVKRLGAEVILFGNDFDEAKTEAIRLCQQNNFTMIHPYDDPYVIAGQGTIGAEILHQLKSDKLDAVFCCVGGGGLISGVATYIKQIRPDIKIYGVNAEDSDAMTKSLQEGQRVELKEAVIFSHLPDKGLFADGTSIRIVGKETFRLAQKYVDGMITVGTDEICKKIQSYY